jgi:hypothetical protein
MLSSHLHLDAKKGLFSSDIPIKTLYVFLISPMRLAGRKAFTAAGTKVFNPKNIKTYLISCRNKCMKFNSLHVR